MITPRAFWQILTFSLFASAVSSPAASPAEAQVRLKGAVEEVLAAKLHEFYNLNAPQAELHQPLTKPRAKKFGKTRWPGASSACNRLRLKGVTRHLCSE